MIEFHDQDMKHERHEKRHENENKNQRSAKKKS